MWLIVSLKLWNRHATWKSSSLFVHHPIWIDKGLLYWALVPLLGRIAALGLTPGLVLGFLLVTTSPFNYKVTVISLYKFRSLGRRGPSKKHISLLQVWDNLESVYGDKIYNKNNAIILICKTAKWPPRKQAQVVSSIKVLPRDARSYDQALVEVGRHRPVHSVNVRVV